MFWYWSMPFGALVLILLIDWIQKVKDRASSRRIHREYQRYVDSLSPELRAELEETERLRARGEITPEESARRHNMIFYKSQGII